MQEMYSHGVSVCSSLTPSVDKSDADGALLDDEQPYYGNYKTEVRQKANKDYKEN